MCIDENKTLGTVEGERDQKEHNAEYTKNIINAHYIYI